MQEGELVDWSSDTEAIEVVRDEVLFVRGTTPILMDVRLVPAPAGVEKWEYWPVEVRGFPKAEEEPQVVTSFEATGGVNELSRGTGKIELIGATKRAFLPPK
jgi:hypothetical protein